VQDDPEYSLRLERRHVCNRRMPDPLWDVIDAAR